MEFATVVRNMSRILCDLSGISPSPLRWLDASWGNWLTAWVARGFFHPRQLLHSDSGSLPQLHSESSSNLSESSNDIRSPSSHSNILWSQLQLVCSAWPVEIFKHPFLYPIFQGFLQAESSKSPKDEVLLSIHCHQVHWAGGSCDVDRARNPGQTNYR